MGKLGWRLAEVSGDSERGVGLRLIWRDKRYQGR